MNRIRTRSWGAVALAAAVAVITAACSSSSSSSQSSAAGQTTATTAGARDPNATLTYSYSLAATNLDPHKTPLLFDVTYLRPVYDTLISKSPKGEIVPSLATAYKFSDPSTLEFTLRSGVKFHDGATFDAAAVKANIERAKTIAGGTQAKSLTSVTSVEVVDPATVRLHLGPNAGAILGTLTGLAGMMISPNVLANDLSRTAVGTGAYKLTDLKPGIEADYEAFPGAWNSKAAGAAKLRIINNGDSGQRVNQLLTGQTDIANIDGNQVDQVKGKGFNTASAVGNELFYVGINWKRPALQSVDARRAILLAVDRKALLDGVQFGFGEVATQVAPSTDATFNSTIKGAIDLVQAKKLAASSGLQGQTLKVVFSGIPSLTAYAEALQPMLQALGVKVELSPVDRAQQAQQWASGNYDLYMNYYPGAADQSLAYATLFGEGSLLNPGGAAPASVTSLMTTGLSDTAPDARTKTFKDLAAAVDQQALAVLIDHPATQVAGSADVQGLTGFIGGIPELRGVSKKAK